MACANSSTLSEASRLSSPRSLQAGPPIAIACLAMCGTSPHAFSAQWPTFHNETAQRLIAAPDVGATDTEEKDYAWDDLDKDGDIDLVCVRKEPFNTPGRFRNVLFMNEGISEGHDINGVLVDRTLEYATRTDIGGQGMLDLTADRDVAILDVDGDGWLDVVTSTTYGQGLPQSLSHPRVYINLGQRDGSWMGLRFESARTPTMPIEPNFCGIGFGDVTNDHAPDLYFVDYNNSLEDRLWVNDGLGFFADESLQRMTSEMLESDFGIHAVIADMNNDGVNDIVKDRGSTQSTPPIRVTISYNNPDLDGTFNEFQVVYQASPYHVNVGDLNNDGLLDLVIDDDGIDRYYLNLGAAPGEPAEFFGFQFPAASNNPGGNIVIDDIDRDGRNDVIIADVDVDCCGCARHMHFWRSNGDEESVFFVEESGGIPISARTGTHDVAIFDINGDDWLDMVIGTCTGTSVWIAEPVVALDVSYPDGRPLMLQPQVLTAMLVELSPTGGSIESGSATLHVAINDESFEETPMMDVGQGVYSASLPAVSCLDNVKYFVSAQVADESFTDPADAPAAAYSAVGATTTMIDVDDDLEDSTDAWGTQADASLTSGHWQAVDPNHTITGVGEIAAPADDATAGEENTIAFVTENGPAGDTTAGNYDVDGGPARLLSPTFDLDDADALVSADVWFYTSSGVPDVLSIDLSSDDGQSWIHVKDVDSTDQNWQNVSFVAGEYIERTATMRVRFSTCDCPNDSVTEAAVDNFLIEKLFCSPSCSSDFDGSGDVDPADLAILLAMWGACPQKPCNVDLDGDNVVGPTDLASLLSEWGLCD